MPVIWSTAVAVCSRFAAWPSVRVDSSSIAPEIWSAPPRIVATTSAMAPIAEFNASAAALKSRRSRSASLVQLGFDPRDEVALGEFGEAGAERGDDRLQPLGGVRALGGDRRLGFLDRGQILQRLDDADHGAGRIAHQVGVDREIDAHAARQVAPVLGFQAIAAAAVALRGVERAHFRRAAFQREIGEAGRAAR